MIFKLQVRSWERFILIPFLQLLCISALINFVKLFSQEFIAVIPLLILLCVLMVYIPYSMLKLAPKHCYLAAAGYMLLLFSLTQILLFMASYDSDQPFKPRGIAVFFIVTMVAMMIYRMQNDPEDDCAQNKEPS